MLKNTWTITGVDTILLAYEKVVRTLRCPLSALMLWGQGRCAALPRGLCDRGRETRGFSCVSSPWGAVLVSVATMDESESESESSSSSFPGCFRIDPTQIPLSEPVQNDSMVLLSSFDFSLFFTLAPPFQWSRYLRLLRKHLVAMGATCCSSLVSLTSPRHSQAATSFPDSSSASTDATSSFVSHCESSN